MNEQQSSPGDYLSYSASSSTPELFKVVDIRGSVLTLAGSKEGTGTLSVVARDNFGGSASASIRVDVLRSNDRR